MRIMACNGRIINVFPGCIPKVGSVGARYGFYDSQLDWM